VYRFDDKLQVDFKRYDTRRSGADVEICWILEFAKAQVVLVDKEYEELVRPYNCKRIIADLDVDGKTGDYEDVVRQGQEIDLKSGGKGWDNLLIDDIDENDTNVLNCTSGTTSNPKVFPNGSSY
jgi:long-subunit acyl-CoA synthetase (AMP-forming)